MQCSQTGVGDGNTLSHSLFTSIKTPGHSSPSKLNPPDGGRGYKTPASSPEATPALPLAIRVPMTCLLAYLHHCAYSREVILQHANDYDGGLSEITGGCNCGP